MPITIQKWGNFLTNKWDMNKREEDRRSLSVTNVFFKNQEIFNLLGSCSEEKGKIYIKRIGVHKK